MKEGQKELLVLTFFLLFLVLLLKFSSITGSATRDPIIVDIQLEPEYSQIESGDNILLGVRLINQYWQEGDGIKDITVKTFVKDSEGSKILLNSQTTAVGKSAGSLILSLFIPKELKASNYEIVVEVEDTETKEILGSSTQRIIVLNEREYLKLEENSLFFIKIILGVIAFLLLTIIFILFKRKFRSR